LSAQPYGGRDNGVATSPFSHFVPPVSLTCLEVTPKKQTYVLILDFPQPA